MRTEAEWEQRRIQAKREFRQQLEALIPDLHGLIQELRTMPSAMPPPSGYEAEAKRFTIPGYVPGYFREFFEGEEQIHFNEWSFFSGAIRAVYNEVPSQPVYMKKTAPEVYNRYGYDEYRIDYQPGAPRRQQYKFLWRTAGQKQKWIQFELNRFLSWQHPVILPIILMYA